MPIREIDARTLKDWLDRDEAVLVDVREPAEYHSCCIPNATLVPLATLDKTTLPDYAGKKLVLHCERGMRGGKGCAHLLATLGGLDIYNLEGGIAAWRDAGLPVKKAGAHLPLGQQVQLVIGLLLLTGVTLGVFMAAIYLLIPFLLGMGLVFAGLTGFCGLARLLAKMPWNKA